MFETGKEYSREDVHQVTGGSKHTRFCPSRAARLLLRDCGLILIRMRRR
jgi:hypothetical protein